LDAGLYRVAATGGVARMGAASATARGGGGSHAADQLPDAVAGRDDVVLRLRPGPVWPREHLAGRAAGSRHLQCAIDRQPAVAAALHAGSAGVDLASADLWPDPSAGDAPAAATAARVGARARL